MKLFLFSLAAFVIAFAMQSLASHQTSGNLTVASYEAYEPDTSEPTEFWNSEAHAKAYVGGERGVQDLDSKPDYNLLAQAWAQ